MNEKKSNIPQLISSTAEKSSPVASGFANLRTTLQKKPINLAEETQTLFDLLVKKRECEMGIDSGNPPTGHDTNKTTSSINQNTLHQLLESQTKTLAAPLLALIKEVTEGTENLSADGLAEKLEEIATNTWNEEELTKIIKFCEDINTALNGLDEESYAACMIQTACKSSAIKRKELKKLLSEKLEKGKLHLENESTIKDAFKDGLLNYLKNPNKDNLSSLRNTGAALGELSSYKLQHNAFTTALAELNQKSETVDLEKTKKLVENGPESNAKINALADLSNDALGETQLKERSLTKINTLIKTEMGAALKLQEKEPASPLVTKHQNLSVILAAVLQKQEKKLEKIKKETTNPTENPSPTLDLNKGSSTDEDSDIESVDGLFFAGTPTNAEAPNFSSLTAAFSALYVGFSKFFQLMEACKGQLFSSPEKKMTQKTNLFAKLEKKFPPREEIKSASQQRDEMEKALKRYETKSPS